MDETNLSPDLKLLQEQQLKLVIPMQNQEETRGILIVGANLMSGASCRYVVYERDSQSLEATEFALSLDNLRPISVMP